MALTDDQYLRATGAATCESRTAAQVKSDLDLEIGTDLQAYSLGLTNLASLTVASGEYVYTTAENVYNSDTITAFGRSLLDDTNAATVLGTLGLSTDLPNLTDAEVTQLENISTHTISEAQWGYVAGANQAVKTDSDVQFGSAVIGVLTATSTTTLDAVTMTDAEDITLGTTTGTKIGTAAAQKLGFYGTIPVVQLAKASYNNWAAFGDVVDALVAIGLFDAA